MMDRTASLQDIYGEKAGEQLLRYRGLAVRFTECFGEAPERFFRAPGRVELGGNHTDHQGGVTLSAAVDLDMIAAVSFREDKQLVLYSEGWEKISLSLEDTEKHPEEEGSTRGLIRGVASGFRERLGHGYEKLKGMNICLSSQLPAGGGLSSSAAFEILLGTILNTVSGGSLSARDLAEIGQKTENIYFGKPCGQLDQLSCAWGGVISVDFGGEKPWIRRVGWDPDQMDCRLYMVYCGAGHEKLTEEYAAIPAECARVAGFFGWERLSQVPEQDFWDALPGLRKALGDRPLLRAIHVYEENRRALAQAMCLLKGNREGFLRLVRESGRSSAMYLQNVVPAGAIEHQEMLLTLALCENILRGQGAVRVHGGGFGGTVEAFVPRDKEAYFRQRLEALLGPGSVFPLRICPAGGTEVSLS